MENLKPYRNYLSILSIIWHTIVICLAGAIGYGVYYFFGLLPGLVTGIGALMIGTLILSFALSRPAASATEFLAAAILHVSSEKSDVPAPQISSVKASQEFLERLASYVYDMANKSVMDQYPKNKPNLGIDMSMPIEPVDDSPLPFFVLNREKSIVYLSKSALNYLETAPEEIVGKPFYDVLKFMFSSDDTLDNWLQFASQRTVTATRSWDRVKLVLPSGTTKQLDMSARFSKDDPSGSEVILVLFDHTEKYSKDDGGASFVSMAVHELRTPLTIMRGYIEVFEEEIADKLDAEQTEFLHNLSVQAQQLGSFVGNIQNLARIESNSLELQLKEDDWTAVLSSALADMEMRAKVRHKVIQRKIADDLPKVGIDRTTMYEVLVNIIENAIKYTHADTPIIVSTYQKDANWVETTVQDFGIGIPDSLLGHIFDKFYRSHRTSKSVGGTGLGLYISKTIIEAHGGEIWVKTKEGEGTTFGFTIPTYQSIASEANSSDNKIIERSAHGWIKNHTLYRG